METEVIRLCKISVNLQKIGLGFPLICAAYELTEMYLYPLNRTVLLRRIYIFQSKCHKMKWNYIFAHELFRFLRLFLTFLYIIPV